MYPSPGQPIPAEATIPPRIGKLRASMMLTRQSFRLLMQDKEILAFPVLSGITSILVSAVGLTFFAVVILRGHLSMEAVGELKGNSAEEIVGYAIMFLSYLLTAFIATFFQAGLTAIVHGRIQGKDLTFGDGMHVAWEHRGKIFLWSVLAATIGVVLRVIADRSKTLGRIVAGLVGATWSIVTLFIVPTLILETGTVTDAIHRSAETFKRAWGETLIMSFSTGFSMRLIGVSVGVIAFALIIITQPDIAQLLIGLGILVFFYVGLGILSTSLSAVFRVVLYQYAKTGAVPQGFDPRLVMGAVRRA